MRHFYAGIAALACFGANAGTYQLTITNSTVDLIDMTPGDQFAPGYTANSGGLMSLIGPVDYYDKGGKWETNTVLPASIGPSVGRMDGFLAPGSALSWTYTVRLKLTAIDVDGYWDHDEVLVQSGFYASCQYPSTSEIPSVIFGSGGTFNRISNEQEYTITLVATNPGDAYRPYQMGWFNQYQFFGYSEDRPVTTVPEPETYALLLAGLGIVGSVARRRKTNQSTYS